MDAILLWYTVYYNWGVRVNWLETEALLLSGVKSVSVLSFSNLYCVQCSCLIYIILLCTNSLPLLLLFLLLLLLLLLYLLLAEMKVMYHCCTFKVVRVVSHCKVVVM